ncbi:MAG: TIGR02757 family protein [Acidobacteriota bacterium]|nr:TIGR02757 family protein [Acidobacteriota bacterium]
MRRRTGGPRDLALLGEHLETLRQEWRSRRLDSDPLVFVHRYADPADREVVAFLSASLAFGRVASIQASVGRVLEVMGASPAEFLAAWDERPIPPLSRFVHRWVTGSDVQDFLRMVKRARRAHGSLGALFAAGDEDGPADYVAALSSFHRNLFLLLSSPGAARTALSRGLRFLLPSPAAGSACKRSHLFLRWMIRTEGFDLGLWTGGRFTPARLLLPMDVHVHRISNRIGLTRRKTADLAASREATGWLRLLNPEDPVAYDWPLSRLGILSEPMTLPTRPTRTPARA